MSLVVTGFLSCDCPIGGTNFSEWVQIFKKNLFRGKPILRGSKLNMTVSWLSSNIIKVEPLGRYYKDDYPDVMMQWTT